MLARSSPRAQAEHSVSSEPFSRPVAMPVSNKESNGESGERETLCPRTESPKMHKANFLNFTWVHPSGSAGGQEKVPIWPVAN